MNRAKLSLLVALNRVLEPTGFPEGSSDLLFRDAQFGRDALETAEDLLEFRPDVARAVILRLAELQGTTYDPRSEEEPGRIHHEYRAESLNGREVQPSSLKILHDLSEHWGFGRDSVEYITYPTVDATPLFVRLVGRYTRAYGDSILGEQYTPRHGGTAEQARIIDSVQSAVDWILRRLDASTLGLLEFQHAEGNPSRFQAWKDGGSSYLHPDGRYANYNGPIASIEVQGLAYDALLTARDLLNTQPAVTRALLDAAKKLQASVLDLFWMPEERYFAMALDRDPRSMEPRQVSLISSNPGELLDSRIFDDLNESAKNFYVGAIVERIYGKDFLTPAGIRCTSVVHKDLLGYAAYQSSWTVWHKDSYDIAKGLRRQGFTLLADDLETRILNAINLSGHAGEFLYVAPDGRIAYDATREPLTGSTRLIGTNVPERDQAWSIAAGLAIKWGRGHPRPSPPATSRFLSQLEDRLLEATVLAVPLRRLPSTKEVGGAFWVDVKAGWESERSFRESHGT